MPKVTGICECSRREPDYICQMHLKSAKGALYDPIQDSEANRQLQRDSKRRYRGSTKNTNGKRQAIFFSAKTSGTGRKATAKA